MEKGDEKSWQKNKVYVFLLTNHRWGGLEAGGSWDRGQKENDGETEWKTDWEEGQEGDREGLVSAGSESRKEDGNLNWMDRLKKSRTLSSWTYMWEEVHDDKEACWKWRWITRKKS